MQAVIDAINARDIGALRSACSSVHDEQTINLQAHLPTPDPALTSALQSEIDDVNTAMHICMSLGPNSTSADLEQADSFMQQASDHMRTADAILRRALRQCQETVNELRKYLCPRPDSNGRPRD
jgi:hypothetical protein